MHLKKGCILLTKLLVILHVALLVDFVLPIKPMFFLVESQLFFFVQPHWSSPLVQSQPSISQMGN